MEEGVVTGGKDIVTAVLSAAPPSSSSSSTALLLSSSSGSGGGGLSKGQKILLIATAALGVGAVALIVRYYRRRSNNKDSGTSSRGSGDSSQLLFKGGHDFPDGLDRSGPSSSSRPTSILTSTPLLNPSSTLVIHRRKHDGGGSGDTGSFRHDKGGRSSSLASSILTQSTLVSNSIAVADATLSCTQLGILGMETLEKSVSFWEESLTMLNMEREGDLSEEEQGHCLKTITQLEEIVHTAKHLQQLAEELYLDEGSVLYADADSERTPYDRTRLRSVSSVESFMSAEDFLSDDEEIRQSLESAGFLPGEVFRDGVYPLFEAAMRLVEVGAVPFRSMKTDMVGCTNGGDQEYLAKLHCLRGAFSRIISNAEQRQWICLRGKEVFCQILMKADKDPTEFEISYDAIINWSHDGGNWGLIENELKDRGLRALTFYDIVLDYIFLDAFEDLESPPASVLAVTQNRWLSNSFKETALSTAVWSVLKTKRKWLRYPDGFMAHFYTLSEQIMPTLAWGFLGPVTSIQDLCLFFKDKFLEFLNAIFAFEQVRYTTLDELAADVMKKLQLMHSQIARKILETPSPS